MTQAKRDAVIILCDRYAFDAIDQFGHVGSFDLLAQFFCQLPLFALQAIGVVCLIGNHAHVELSNNAFVAVAELPLRANQPAVDEFLRNAEPIEHVECRRMEG